MTLRVGMVAGEPSGDLLASRILRGIAHGSPQASCQGIGGPAMQAQGFNAWYPMNALTVFGYVDALKRLPRLYRTYTSVKKRWLTDKPDVFVGIDAPDFNLRLEHELRQAGIPTVHFVGPSIWAWRYERIHAIRAAVSHMLVLFPFEVEIYQKEGIPVTYVGHPLAQNIPVQPNRLAARNFLGLDPNARVLAVMPGSRSSEIRLLAPRFLQAVQLLQRDDPQLQVLVPMVNAERRQEFQQILAANQVKNCTIIGAQPSESGPATTFNAHPDADCLAGTLHPGCADTETARFAQQPAAWNAMEAADAVLVASGTATLEAALFKRPMVISYVLSPLMRKLMAWKSGQQRPYVPWVGLPNVLAKDFVVPELLQDDATPEKLARATHHALHDVHHRADVERRFTAIHHDLRLDTPGLATRVILECAGHAS